TSSITVFEIGGCTAADGLGPRAPAGPSLRPHAGPRVRADTVRVILVPLSPDRDLRARESAAGAAHSGVRHLPAGGDRGPPLHHAAAGDRSRRAAPSGVGCVEREVARLY